MFKLKEKDTRNLVAQFVASASNDILVNVDGFKFERFRLHDGISFQVSDKTGDAQRLATLKILRSLGPVRGHSKTIVKRLWDLVAEVVRSEAPCTKDQIDRCLTDLESDEGNNATLVKPCANLVAINGERFSIGPLSISKAADRINDWSERHPKVTFAPHSEWALGIIPGLSGETYVCGLPPTIWEIELLAADPVKEEEAAWLADVALTLIRLAVPFENLGPMAAGIGKVESHPFQQHEWRDNAISWKSDGSINLGGSTAGAKYEIDSVALKILREVEVQEKIDLIFGAVEKTLAERFYQGCGWLTRARRQPDRSDRLLYFFTAIESLLSSSDKGTPVIQTISRHAAVLLSDDNEVRVKVAQQIRDLYGLRSALVHTGRRGVYDGDVGIVQVIAEDIFDRIWSSIPLDIPHQKFVEELARASYGLPLGAIL